MLVTFIFSDLSDLTWTLTFPSITLVLMRCLLQTYKSSLGEFELFAVCLTDHRAQTVKTVFFTFDLTVN